MKRVKLVDLIVALAGVLATGLAAQAVQPVNSPLNQQMEKIFPEIASGYIDLNGNGKMDQSADLDEVIPESRVKDGQLQPRRYSISSSPTGLHLPRQAPRRASRRKDHAGRHQRAHSDRFLRLPRRRHRAAGGDGRYPLPHSFRLQRGHGQTRRDHHGDDHGLQDRGGEERSRFRREPRRALRHDREGLSPSEGHTRRREGHPGYGHAQHRDEGAEERSRQGADGYKDLGPPRRRPGGKRLQPIRARAGGALPRDPRQRGPRLGLPDRGRQGLRRHGLQARRALARQAGQIRSGARPSRGGLAGARRDRRRRRHRRNPRSAQARQSRRPAQGLHGAHRPGPRRHRPEGQRRLARAGRPQGPIRLGRRRGAPGRDRGHRRLRDARLGGRPRRRPRNRQGPGCAHAGGQGPRQAEERRHHAGPHEGPPREGPRSRPGNRRRRRIGRHRPPAPWPSP